MLPANGEKKVLVDVEELHVCMRKSAEHMMKKLDKIHHQAEESHRCLTSQELDDVKDIWEAFKSINAVDVALGTK